MKKRVIALDGPAGAGKSSVAGKIADRLGFVHIDTGAMYRSVARLVLEAGISPEDEAAVGDLAKDLTIRFARKGDTVRVLANGRDVTELIRTPEVTATVARVSQYLAVREAMVRQQRDMAAEGSVVLDGRDIGTVVVPDACVKIFLTASVQERARRRYQELLDKGQAADLEKLQQEIAERDRLDRERTISPLIQAEDAVLLDTTGMDIEQVLENLLQLYQQRSPHV